MVNEFWHGDCLNLMQNIPDNSVQLVFADLPYGTTKAHWDQKIPLNWHIGELSEDQFMLRMFKDGYDYKQTKLIWDQNKKPGFWQRIDRILKPNGVVVCTAQIPFSVELAESNRAMLRYEWIWEKTQATGFQNAKKMVMKAHENVLIFYNKLPKYNPQKTFGHKPVNSYTKYIKTQNNTELYGKMNTEISGGGETDRYPRSVITFKSDKQTLKLHSTQKPYALVEYFVKTYTDEGDVVVDPVSGSGTTGAVCKDLKRPFILIEKDEVEFNKGKKRVLEHDKR